MAYLPTGLLSIFVRSVSLSMVHLYFLLASPEWYELHLNFTGIPKRSMVEAVLLEDTQGPVPTDLVSRFTFFC